MAADAGYSLRCFILEGTSTELLDGLDAEIVVGDVRDEEACRRAARDVDVVFHIAGLAREWSMDRHAIYDVNVLGTRNVCRAALACGARRLVYTSTAMTVGAAANGRADEDTVWNLRDSGHYALSKLLGEKEVFMAGARGLQVNVICPHQLLGPGDVHVTTLNGFILRYLEGRLPAVIDTLVQPVDVRDVAAAHIAAARVETFGERYVIAGDEVLTVRAFFESLERQTGVPAPRTALSPLLLRLASYPMTFVADHITHRPPLVPASNAAILSKRTVFDCERAKRDLGFTPRPWLTSALDSIAWYQARRAEAGEARRDLAASSVRRP